MRLQGLIMNFMCIELSFSVFKKYFGKHFRANAQKFHKLASRFAQTFNLKLNFGSIHSF